MRRSRRLQGLKVSPDKSVKSLPSITNAATVTPYDTSCHELAPPEEEEFDPTVPVPTDDKTPESIHQVQPDCVPFIDGREDPNYDQPSFRHKTRPTNSSDFQRDPKIRINFPKSSDALRWKELNQELSDALPKIFDRRRIKSSAIDKLIEDFDEWLHAFFMERCGPLIDEPSANPPVTPVSKRHRGLERLRQQKNKCKKAFKVIKKAGLCFSLAGQNLKKLWLSLVHKHNKLRCKVARQKSRWQKVQAARTFKKDPNKYAQNMFKGDSLDGVPSFSKEEAEDYFKRLYHDECRSEDFSPLEGMERPPPPSYPFFDEPPLFREVKRHTTGKRNNAAPGMNSLPYLIYKRCVAILHTAHKIFLRIFRDKVIPRAWSIAFIVLLQKVKGVTNIPSEFRPIAITNTLGKIFFSIVSDRLQRFLVKNNFIQTTIQKGFLAGVPGCVEHVFSLWEALREAKEHKRAIVISWLDLANAYGSVMHNLIQFALNWYHVPSTIQHLIFDYYEKICAKVTTREWSTGFFFFDIGLFQGCVLSSILFDCVFNLLLDFLAPHKDEGYTFKNIPVTIMHKSYADDLQFSTTTPEGHQRVLDCTMVWLNWTRSMKAKPSKCVSLGFRQFRKGVTSTKGFIPVQDSIYSAYDPLLLIDGKPLTFIDSIVKGREKQFKFLGRWLSKDLNDEQTKSKFKADFFGWLNRVDKDPINGLMKLWVYQHYIIPKSSWPLLIQDFNRYFAVKDIEQPTGVYLRRWAGLFKSSDIGTLYRPREKLGLNLTSITVHFESMRIIRCHLLKHSKDEDITAVYQHRADRFKDNRTIWRDTQFLEKVESMVEHESKFQAADAGDNRGLGNNIYTAHLDTAADKRKRCGKAVHRLATEKHMAHAAGLAMQSVWMHWAEHSNAFDLSWRNLIWGPGPRIISFVLNATINSLPTPDMLNLMNLSSVSSCSICGTPQCTLFHILVNCTKALTDKRYTWRHDSVLATMLQILVPILIRHNASELPSTKPSRIAFVNATSKIPGSSQRRDKSLLSAANDWQLLIDFDCRRMLFPPIIVATSERPDVVIWSTSTKTVIMVELTCPAEENFMKAHTRKVDRYATLCEQIRDAGWTPVIRTAEAGARGFVSHRFKRVFRELGLSSREATTACKNVSSVVARCSYGIWLQRNSVGWNASRELVVPNHFLQPAPTTTPTPLLMDSSARGDCDWHNRLGQTTEPPPDHSS